MDGEKITYFAETDHRKSVRFGIKAKDRSRHIYVIGKTGMGKTTLLANLVKQDIWNGEGFCFVDPHGTAAEEFLNYIPKERMKDVIYFAPQDLENPISFNVMEDVGKDQRHLVANGLLATFEKIWPDVWSARMEYILNNIILALLEYPNSTLLGVNRMLSDKDFRNKVVENVQDPTVKSFWTEEFAKYTDRYAQEAGPAIQNKIGQFTSNPLIRNIIGQPHSSFDFRTLMDEKKIFIANLSKGQVGEINSNLLGGMLITKLYLAGMGRSNLTEAQIEKLPAFHLFVDEFQSFANKTFANILSESRKYKLNLVLAHQYVAQMPEEVRDAVFGNVGTLITFRVGSFDAEMLEKEFAPCFTQEDLVNLGFAQIYLRLMINGVNSQPFSARTLGPIEPPLVSHKDEVVEESRRQFSRPRAEVEKEILEWYETKIGSSSGSGVAKTGTTKKPLSKPKKKKIAGPPEGAVMMEEQPPSSSSTLSLSDLSKKNKHKPKNEHVSELRDMLKKAMGDAPPVQKEEKSTPSEKEKSNITPKQEVVKKKEKPPQQSLGAEKEIPEKELREMLKVDGE